VSLAVVDCQAKQCSHVISASLKYVQTKGATELKLKLERATSFFFFCRALHAPLVIAS